ncbi:Fc receptor-like protein 5 isoform X5 [Sus scrofa]|uniref:Fc receptor-like protein 5 isoform X5 n=1 Tax=Sus scrofa TaxID=9823 RepID=UPI0006B1FB89|nr:Fc receptor-like protein 5 isoform X5 [Sus scrofa]
MLLWVSLLVLAPVSGQFATEPKPVISLHPLWTTFFQGETVMLTCNTFRFHAPEKIKLYRWYLEGEIQSETLGNTHEVRETGMYKCQAQDSPPSDAVHLLFSSANLILQAPPYVFEKESVVLRCQAKANTELNGMTLYKHGEVLGVPKKTSEFRIYQAGLKDNGEYRCTGLKKDNETISSNAVKIEVQGIVADVRLYSRPELVFEGKELVLICSVSGVPAPITVSFFKKRPWNKDTKIVTSSETEFKIPAVESSHAGEYYCAAGKNHRSFPSQTLTISVRVPASHPVLTLSRSRAQTLEGDEVSLRCEARRGSLPICFQFYHESMLLKKAEGTIWRSVSFRFTVTAEHSGHYYCTADNGLGPQYSEAASLSVTVPVSRPVLTLRAPRAQPVVGDVAELHCEVQRGSLPIRYQFYHEAVALWSNSVSSKKAFFRFSLTEGHSGNYFCKADNNLGAQRSDTVSLSVRVPVSRPVLTLRAPRAQAVVGDVVELHCEVQKGSPPIRYQFYHKNVTLGNGTSLSGQGVSFNLSLTAEHSGNYSCEADNDLGPQCSEAVTLSITVMTGSRSGSVATSVTGGLLSLVGLAAVALLFYCWFPRKAGGRSTLDSSRNHSASDLHEPTYYNVPGWIELQPVYSNVNPKEGDIVYSEVRSVKRENRHAGAVASAPELLNDKDACVIYSQVKVASAPAPKPQLLDSSTPHR